MAWRWWRKRPATADLRRAWANGSAMGEIVNLRKVRKQAKKREDAERAAANRIVHGRSKAERALQEARTARIQRHLEGHRLDTGDS